MRYRSWMIAGAVALATITVNMTQADVGLQFVPVGDPGNTADSTGYGGFGSVPYTYQIGKYDVTVGQYTAFLNAVAATDTYGLYNTYMATTMPTIAISQSGSPGSYTYSVTGTYAQGVNCPIFNVSWGDAARFCNWLQNGQPIGAEGTGTTETGAYTLNGAITDAALMTVTRSTVATYFLPTKNEWYKAAYYKGGSTSAGYWAYPTQSNNAPSNTLPDTGNGANYYNGAYTDPTNHLTPVGAFSNSPGTYGTYDMGGDVWQWNETAESSSMRYGSGGDWNDAAILTSSSSIGFGIPTYEYDVAANAFVGFRVASVPEPGSLVMTAMIAVTALLYYWRKHA